MRLIRTMDKFLHSLMVIFILSRLASTDEIRQDQATTKDICLFETFQPRCPKNEVILMESATYGRMRIGRCITSEEVEAHRSIVGDDPRYLGCSTDVLTILDQKCSSKPDCEIRVSDISTENVKPCLQGLNVYLELTYICISVVDEKRSCAVTTAKNPVHILGSLASQRLCGTKSQPWNIGAPGGQKVRISVIDFTANTQSNQLCVSYGVIVDKIGQRNTSICRQGTQRTRELFISSGSEADLYFNLLDQKETNTAKFLLKLEAAGCSDMIPPEDAWLKRKDDVIIIGCYSNRQTWQLSCRGGKWVGVLGNCSHGLGVSVQDSVVELQRQTILSHDEQVLAVVAIGGCTLAICLTIVCVGLVYLRKFYAQYKKKHEYKTINYQTAVMQRDDNQDLRFNTTRDITRASETSSVELQSKPTAYAGFVGQDGINIGAI